MKPEKMIHKQVYLKSPVVNEEDYSIAGVFSTDDTDRHGEVVDQTGWKLSEFLANPVILFAHDHWTPAVGKATELHLDGQGNLAGTIKFAVEEDGSGLARTLFNLYKNGFMRAFSVGFENNVVTYDEEADTVTLKENTLYEISCVNVPANAMALAYSKGIDISSLETLNQKELKIGEKELNAIGEVVKEALKSSDSAEEGKKVETPISRAGRMRRINKAIRKLVREKARLRKEYK
jgi:HK97 family phage prohead protease